jgi:hypothetical protein
VKIRAAPSAGDAHGFIPIDLLPASRRASALLPITRLSHKFRLTQEIRASIMEAGVNISGFGGVEHG